MSMHDAAYELERSIRQSDEYSQLKKAYEEVYADEAARKMFESFRDLQLQLQQKQMMGEEISQEEMEKAQQTIALVQQHQQITQMMEAEQQMSTVITDVNKIIMKPLEELYGSDEQQN